MCTVTYLPLKEGFLITSNRDERLIRKIASIPQIADSGKAKILFPRDAEAGGTWIATAQNERTVCLLNGANQPHLHQPPYRKSRGLVVLDYFETQSVDDFKQRYDLQGIEPFTLLVAENNKLFEFKWDGTIKFLQELEAGKPHMLCSVTLYTPEVIAMRKQWFDEWLKHRNTFTVEEILRFHLFAGKGDETTQIRMSRAGIVQTVSITCVEYKAESQRMYYSGLQEGKGFNFSVYSFDASAKQTERLSIS